MKNITLILGLIILTISCNKGDETKLTTNEITDEITDEVTNEPSVQKITKYHITIEGNMISKYEKYFNDVLIETAVFQNFDSVLYMIRTDSSNEIIQKMIYYIASNGLASSAIDSSFSYQGLIVRNLEYEYQDGFLISTIVDWERFGTIVGSGQSTISRTIENENISLTERSSHNGYHIVSCIDYFQYNSLINKIDIIDFSNGITGKISKNLIQYARWNQGCPCFSSSTTAYSNFFYEFGTNGYVTKKIENYTPCTHITKPVSSIEMITIYEYSIH
ncbi:MAG: hypothetical protein HUU34_07695 [Saprospiraceae bacterium]|jgi:hypothetical protein|nr:hypothetical protein [Saprospiraceae bacterium]